MKQGLQMEASKMNSSGSQGSGSARDSQLTCGGSKVCLLVNSGEELVSEASKMSMEVVCTTGSEMAINVSSGSDVGAIGNGIGALVGRKKRGRPRKYESNGNIRRPYVSPPSLHTSPSDYVASKRGRGWPHGFGHPPFLGSLGEMNAYTTGMNFMPHVIEVSPGEDLTAKILATFQAGPRCISILSANGIVYNVIIRQPSFGSSDVLLKYEAQYEILRLSGSYTISGDGRIQTEGFSVLLACSDGCIIGGTLAGSLLAATPIQMVVGSFIPDVHKNKPKKKHQYGLRNAHSSLVSNDEAYME